MKVTDLIIDPKSLGGKFWLTDVLKVVEYKDNRPTDNVLGYRYVVALPERGLDKVNVRIDGRQLLDKPENGYTEVTFNGLEVFIYWFNGQPQVGARAAGVTMVNHKG